MKKKDPGCISATKVPFIWKKLVPSRRVIRLPEIQLYPRGANFSYILLQNKKLARLEDWPNRFTLLWCKGHSPSWAIINTLARPAGSTRSSETIRACASAVDSGKGVNYIFKINACSGRLTLWSGTGFLHINLAFKRIEQFSYDHEMKTREQNRNNKRTEIERFDWFI